MLEEIRAGHSEAPAKDAGTESALQWLADIGARALPEPYRLKGWHLGVIVGVLALVSAVGVFGGLQTLM